MGITRISRDSLEDPTDPVMLYSDTGWFVGRLVFDGKKGQTLSRFELAEEQLPYRPMRLKEKHR